MTKIWQDILQRVQSWPEEAQNELAQVVAEIEAELKAGSYRPTVAELQGIERGLRDAEAGRFASAQDVEAVLRKYKRE